MEEFPQIIAFTRIPIHIHVSSWMLDHCFEGRAVLPAVESMQMLATSTFGHMPGLAVDVMVDAVFLRFLPLPACGMVIEAVNVVQSFTDGTVSASLQTRLQKKNVTRNLEHVSCRFCLDSHKPIVPIPEFESIIDSGSFEVTPARLYGELIPFGAAFRNVHQKTVLSLKGATAGIRTGRLKSTNRHLSGSPFLLDAAFHVACAWGQRYAGVVAFPVAIQQRYIFKPASPNGCFSAVAIPRSNTAIEKQGLCFDIWILDGEKRPVEAAIGVVMKDVSAGRMKVPGWIRAAGGEESR